MSNEETANDQEVVSSSCWAELTSGRDAQASPIQITGKRFVIGRATDCHLQLNVKMLSAHHCYIQRDDDGKVWLCDTSTNGTFINKSTKVPYGQRHELKTGDNIYLVCRKKQPQLDMYYTIRILKDKLEEDSSLEDTLEFSTEEITSLGDCQDEPPSKMPKADGKDQPDCIECGILPGEVTGSPLASTGETPKETPSPIKNSSLEHPRPVSTKKSDTMADYLLCSLCLEILYDPICLQPCLHSYCSGCYSGWMEVSQDCPQCRCKVKCVSKNHMINNLLEAYLTQHPEVKRSASDIVLLDAKNKITEAMLNSKRSFRKKTRQGYDYDSDGSDAYDNESTTDDSYDSDGFRLGLGAAQRIDAMPIRVSALFRCRQCPNFPCRQCSDPVGIQGTVVRQDSQKVETSSASPPVAPTTTDGPKTSTLAEKGRDQTDTPDNPSTSLQEVRRVPFACPPTQVHQNCHCCNELMPDRTNEILTDPNVPPQQCTICLKFFCHMYWGCRLPGCVGCLGKFADLDFGANCLRTIVNENIAESQILTDYLTSLGQNWRDLLQECLARLDNGRYRLVPAVTSVTVLCRQCGLKYFRDLAYNYRHDIPDRQLPAAVTNRTDCYWGRNCRTQKHNPTHAWNYNHICEQTRFI